MTRKNKPKYKYKVKPKSILDAIKNNDFLGAEELIKKGDDVNEKDADGRSCLHWVVWKKDYTLFKLLLAHGAQSNVIDNNGQTILHYAARLDSDEIIRDILELDKDLVNVTNKFGKTALHVNIEFGNEEYIDLKFGKTFDSETQNGYPLQTLLQYKANLDIIDNDSYAPLHYAVLLKKIDTVRFLLLNGVNINAQEYNGLSALHLAILNGDTLISHLLIDFGINLNLPDKDGLTSLDYARKYERIEIEKVILDHQHSLLGYHDDNLSFYYNLPESYTADTDLPQTGEINNENDFS